MHLTDEQFCQLRLYRTPKVGPRTFYQLIQKFGSARAVVAAYDGNTEAPLSLVSSSDIMQEIKALEKIGGHFLFCDHPILQQPWPEGAPPILSYVGDLRHLERPLVAVVGARNASFHGKKMAYLLARDLSDQGVGVVSGLARGIDKSAHEGSLTHGPIAVVGTGLGTIYPEEHADLYQQIRQQGLVISGFAFHEGGHASHFPRRNYIMAALSRAVLVVEAAFQSGSLLTAQYATELGRDVFAVPGSPLDPRSKGVNRLIQDGAPLVLDALDVTDALGINSHTLKTQSKPVCPNPEGILPTNLEDQLLEMLGSTPMMVDDLAQHLNVPLPQVMTLLTKLEIDEKVRTHQGHRVSLALQGGV